MATTEVEVVSPAKVLYTGEAEMIVTRTAGGEIAFLAGHVPFLGALEPCLTRLIGADGNETRLAISGGFVEVRDNRVIILADAAELGAEVDVESARADVRAASDRLRDDADDAEAATLLAAAEARLEAAGARGSD